MKPEAILLVPVAGILLGGLFLHQFGEAGIWAGMFFTVAVALILEHVRFTIHRTRQSWGRR